LLLELIRARSSDPVFYIRNMGWFRIAMMHTKLLIMKWGMWSHQATVENYAYKMFYT
jgi:hypothetical protein